MINRISWGSVRECPRLPCPDIAISAALRNAFRNHLAFGRSASESGHAECIRSSYPFIRVPHSSRKLPGARQDLTQGIIE
jgi:hypothetical protein